MITIIITAIISILAGFCVSCFLVGANIANREAEIYKEGYNKGHEDGYTKGYGVAAEQYNKNK